VVDSCCVAWVRGGPSGIRPPLTHSDTIPCCGSRVRHGNEVLVLVPHSQHSVKWCSGHIVPICTLHHLTLCWCCSTTADTDWINIINMLLMMWIHSVTAVVEQHTKPCSPWECSQSTHQGEPACAPGIQGVWALQGPTPCNPDVLRGSCPSRRAWALQGPKPS